MKVDISTFKKIGIVGTGLIGGSYARAIRGILPGAELLGMDRSVENLQQAMELGFIDGELKEEELPGLDLLLLCLPVDALQRVLPEMLDAISEDCLVADAGSTKQALCEAVAEHPRRRNYLSCHPIAGTEFSGPAAAIPNLYEGKTQIICEVEKTAFALQEKGLELFRRMGMRIRYMNPEAHDKHIAFVSHLSHISSFMLGKTVMEEERIERDIFDMAGSGFESTVRLAKSSPDMWAPIFRQNKVHVLRTLDRYIANLEEFRTWMEEDEFEAIHHSMKEINRIRQILEGIPLTKTID